MQYNVVNAAAITATKTTEVCKLPKGPGKELDLHAKETGSHAPPRKRGVVDGLGLILNASQLVANGRPLVFQKLLVVCQEVVILKRTVLRSSGDTRLPTLA